MGIAFEIKDVALAEVVFTDLSEIKKRPVLIVEELQHDDFLTLPITSIDIENIRENESLITNGDFEEGQIPKTSKILITKPYVVNKSLLERS